MMSWQQEIFRAFFLAIGTLEICTNTGYLLKKNGLISARKQHQELPKNLPDKNIRLKVSFMLLFGLVFFIVSLSSYILHKSLDFMTLISLILFAFYGVSEAIYYRFWKTSGFAIVTVILLVIYIVL